MRIPSSALLAIILLGSPYAGPASQIDLSNPPPPPPAEPVFDPFHAAKSIEIGNFYLKKGNYDAAIDRYQEAAAYEPTLARPWELLGEVYEKKHEPAKALEAYKKYLQILPGATDGAKVKQRIAALSQKTGSKTAK